MLAVWLVGFEEDPDQSGEICIAELYGDRIGATGWHTYAAAWNTRQTRFYVDDRLVRTVPQGLDYPLQLMIDLFEFPAGDTRTRRHTPRQDRRRRPGPRLPAPSPEWE
jgi:hypothetical protein